MNYLLNCAWVHRQQMRSVEGTAVQCRRFFVKVLASAAAQPLPASSSTSTEFLSTGRTLSALSLSHSVMFRQVFSILPVPVSWAFYFCPTAPHCPSSKTRKAHVILFAVAFKLAWLSRQLLLHSPPFFHSLFSSPHFSSLKCICICALLSVFATHFCFLRIPVFIATLFLAEAKQNKRLKNNFKGSGGLWDPHPLILPKSFTELSKFEQGIRVHGHF